MATVHLEPLTMVVPLREDPPGVFRVGNSRVSLESVLHAYRQGEPPQGIVEMYPALELGDVFTVIGYYLAHRPEVDAYLRQCEEEAAALRKQIDSSQPAGATKENLLARARAKGLNF